MSSLKKLGKLIIFPMLLALCACGEIGQTNGNLQLTATVDTTSPVAVLNATATLTPAQINSPVTFTVSHYYGSEPSITHVRDYTINIGTIEGGKAILNDSFPKQSVESYIMVSAKAGDIPSTPVVLKVPALSL